MNTAMILAAGRGERLRPITERIPKALCMVKGAPLIEHHVIRLRNAGFKRIIINHAYLGGLIRQHLGDGSSFGVEIHYSPEPPGGLETGGGIQQALPWFENKPFITVNADIYTDFDFSTLCLDSVHDLHLVLVKSNPLLRHHGDFGFTQELGLSNKGIEYTFAGIACYHPSLFAQSLPGRYSVTPLIRKIIEQKKATAQVHEGFWFDIGSVSRLAAANEFIKCDRSE